MKLASDETLDRREVHKYFFTQLMKDEGTKLVSGQRAKLIGDSGGATKYGISLSFLHSLDINEADFNHDGTIDEKDIVILTLDQAEELYYKYFFPDYILDLNNLQLAYRVYNFGVNAGPVMAIILLQETINKIVKIHMLKVDGLLGIKTVTAANSIMIVSLLDRYTESIKQWYKKRNKPQFLRGWLNRLKNLLPDWVVKKFSK